MKVLITSISFKVQLAKAFKKAGWEVYTHDCNQLNSELHSSYHHFISPRTNDPDYASFLLKFCQKYQIDLLVPTRDGELCPFLLLKNSLESMGTKVLVSNECQRITNKQLMLERLDQLQIIDTPKTYHLETSLDKVKYPLFIKPIHGQASQDLHLIQTSYELAIWLREHKPHEYLIQEYLDPTEWIEYSIDTLYDFESNLVGAIPRKRQLVHNGESQITTIDLLPGAQEKMRLLGLEFALIGHNVIQVFVKDDQMKMIEINPRFGGASNLAIQGGLDSPKILLMMLHKFTLKNLQEQFKPVQGLKMIRHSFDRFYLEGQNYISKDPKILCFDMDGTICSEKGLGYDTEEVYPQIRDKIQFLYDQGHQILVFTARGVKSGNDWKPLVKQQLDAWKVPYHRIIDRKPFADYYIDNKGIDVLDF